METDTPFRATLRRLDVLNPRVHKDVAVRTLRGGTLSLIGIVFTTLLALTSAWRWAFKNRTTFVERLLVDTELDRKLPIHLDIAFPRLSCADVELVAMDVAGEAQLDMGAEVTKIRIKDGIPLGGDAIPSAINRDKRKLKENEKAILKAVKDTPCGSCYGAEQRDGDCCRTCHDVKARYAARNWDTYRISREAEQCLREMSHPEIAVMAGEGCMLSARMLVKKVAGNFHIALGQTRTTDALGLNLVHTFQRDKLGEFDTSHNITKLMFGDYLKMDSPLDGTSRYVDTTLGQTATMQYFIHLVPEVWDGMDERLVSYRFTHSTQYIPVLDPVPDKQLVTTGDEKTPRHLNFAGTLPGVFFVYDFLPFMHITAPVQMTLIDLLVDLVSIAGGLIAVLKFSDAALGFVGL